MSVLIIVEHDNKQLNPTTLHAVTAAAKLGKVDLLVAGSGASAVVESAKQVAGGEKVLVADAAHMPKVWLKSWLRWLLNWQRITAMLQQRQLHSVKTFCLA
ncbi:EtfA protein [Neisseria meningitidis]|nr:EtfA protein [Neisseria meningitidis]